VKPPSHRPSRADVVQSERAHALWIGTCSKVSELRRWTYYVFSLTTLLLGVPLPQHTYHPPLTLRVFEGLHAPTAPS
jgi:hypothetical protein